MGNEHLQSGRNKIKKNFKSDRNIGNYLGNFTNELQTSEEPYGWKLILENAFSSGRQEDMEEMMKSYAM